MNNIRETSHNAYTTADCCTIESVPTIDWQLKLIIVEQKWGTEKKTETITAYANCSTPTSGSPIHTQWITNGSPNKSTNKSKQSQHHAHHRHHQHWPCLHTQIHTYFTCETVMWQTIQATNPSTRPNEAFFFFGFDSSIVTIFRFGWWFSVFRLRYKESDVDRCVLRVRILFKSTRRHQKTMIYRMYQNIWLQLSWLKMVIKTRQFCARNIFRFSSICHADVANARFSHLFF